MAEKKHFILLIKMKESPVMKSCPFLNRSESSTNVVYRWANYPQISALFATTALRSWTEETVSLEMWIGLSWILLFGKQL